MSQEKLLHRLFVANLKPALITYFIACRELGMSEDDIIGELGDLIWVTSDQFVVMCANDR